MCFLFFYFVCNPAVHNRGGGAGQQAEGLLVELALCTAALRLDFCVVFAVFDKRGQPEVGDAGVQTLGEENYGESHARGGADVGQ